MVVVVSGTVVVEVVVVVSGAVVVVVPNIWLHRKDKQPIDIYEDCWVYMTNDGEVKESHD